MRLSELQVMKQSLVQMFNRLEQTLRFEVGVQPAIHYSIEHLLRH